MFRVRISQEGEFGSFYWLILIVCARMSAFKRRSELGEIGNDLIHEDFSLNLRLYNRADVVD